MTDWKGNEIKPGMEICFIRVIYRQYFQFGVLVPIAPGVHVDHMEDKRPDKPCWEVLESFIVDETLCISKTEGNITLKNPLSWIESGLQDDTILAIKGISDNREDYITIENRKA